MLWTCSKDHIIYSEIQAYEFSLSIFFFILVHSFRNKILQVMVKDHVTHFVMVLYHKYNAQMKIYQYCKFQKELYYRIYISC
jgi:hypothetical protein